MNCRMSRGIYLRANGEINCYCSTGENLVLGKVPPDTTNFDFIEDVYRNKNYAHIRESFQQDRIPFPAQCLKCNYLDPGASYDHAKEDREIEWAHLEAASVCNLQCTFCIHGNPTGRLPRNGPQLLPVQLYNKIMDDIHAHGINIKWMYFSGRGEPGLHPALWEMVANAKSKFATNFLVNTNGNIIYSNGIVDSGLDKIKIALDSVNQDTYARYRVKGDIEKIFDLTRRISAYKEKTGSRSPEIIWQKVLFDFNDSDAELIEYQKMAAEFQVNKIRIVNTYTKNYSRRPLAGFPRLFPNIEFIWGGGPRSLEYFNKSAEQRVDTHLEELKADMSIAKHVEVIRKILHLFEQGMEDRYHYDEYARMPLDDSRIYAPRTDFPGHEKYRMLIGQCFAGLAEIYGSQGDHCEAAKYREISLNILQ